MTREVDEEYANGKLKARVEKITKEQIPYLYEDEYIAAGITEVMDQ